MFITHAGLNGVYEAIYEAKPMIMIPLFSDQLANAAILEELGVGTWLKIEKLSKQELLDILDGVLHNKRLEMLQLLYNKWLNRF